MKQYLLALILMFNFTVLSAQTEEVEQPTITETERIIDKYSEKIGAFIESTAEALKVPAEYVYTVLVKQAVVEAVSRLLLSLLLLVLGLIGIFIVYKAHDWFDWDGSPGGMFCCAISGGLILSSIIAFGANADIIVTGFINPDYYAINQIIDILK